MSRFSGPVRVQQKDAKNWLVLTELTYTAREQSFTVPIGMETDFASVPRPLSWLIPRSGTYLPAAIVHDHLYRDVVPVKGISYRDADGVLRQAMRNLGVPFATRWVMWTAVRWAGLFRHGGRAHWWRDAPAILLWTVVTLPVSAPASLIVAVSLAVVVAVESVFYVLLRPFSSKEVNAPLGSRRARGKEEITPGASRMPTDEISAR